MSILLHVIKIFTFIYLNNIIAIEKQNSIYKNLQKKGIKMEDKYPKAYKEVIEILKYVPKESIDKIPQDIIDTYRENMDNDYNFKVDINKSFEEQELLDETKAILANIFRDYWATPHQKKAIINKEKYERQKLEEEKIKKYNPDDLFKNTRENKNTQEEHNLLMEIKKENFFEKIITIVKKIFHIK